MSKLDNLTRRKQRIRASIFGTPERPRLAVNVSNRNVVAQLIDDTTGKTLAYSTTVGKDVKGTMTKKAVWTGQDIAKKAKKAKITAVVFDRGGRLYHGRVKAAAEAARKEGLKF